MRGNGLEAIKTAQSVGIFGSRSLLHSQSVVFFYMDNEDRKLISEACEFFNMMRREYHKLWDLGGSGDAKISLVSVVRIFNDCQYYRREMARISIKIYDDLDLLESLSFPQSGQHGQVFLSPVRNRREILSILHQLINMDATWRSLFHATNGNKPRYLPETGKIVCPFD